MPARSISRWPLFLGGALALLGGVALVAFQGVGYAADQVGLEKNAETTQQLLTAWDKSLAETASSEQIPVTERPGTYEEFGIIYVPRWGRDYVAPILEGDDTVNVSSWVGVDHYPSTQMPGELGNFALTGHNGRLGTGRFSYVERLQPGDNIYVETVDGWYVYSFTHMDLVKPDQNEVLAPVPYQLGAEPTKSVITLMACSRSEGEDVRKVGFGDFVKFVPRADGAPEEVIALQ